MTTHRKRTVPRPKTLERRFITLEYLRSQAALLEDGALQDLDEAESERPVTRADCASSPRPCPWMRCRHHLAIDVAECGSIQMNFPHLDLDEMLDTCALDVADRGGVTLDEAGQRLNVSRQRADQIEKRALITLGRRVAR